VRSSGGIRRAYGLMTEDGVVSKRGYAMAQYAKFIRPGFVRVAATQPAAANVTVTTYTLSTAARGARR
jgi:glucuronoarabinoxylan endo-1,4-beta-xylanase